MLWPKILFAATIIRLLQSCTAFVGSNIHLHQATNPKPCFAQRTFVKMAEGEMDENKAGNASPFEHTPRLPSSSNDQIFQASLSVERAFKEGKTRQLLTIELPLIGATELDDWPGGIKQQYQACQPLVSSILKRLAKSDEDENEENMVKPKVLNQIIDEDDAVGVLQLQANDPKKDKLAIIFPSTETFKTLKQFTDSAGSRLAMFVNPQWRDTNDFGFFGRSDAEKFLEPFEITYHLQSFLVYGRSVRLLRRYPDPWHLFLVDEKTGDEELFETFKEKPTFKQIENVIDEKIGTLSIVERIQQSADFIKDSL